MRQRLFTLQRYVHASEAMKRASANRMQQFFDDNVKRHKNTPGKCKPAGGKIMPKNRFLILLWVKWWVKRNFINQKPAYLTQICGFCWRSKRDLNSRGPFGPYALSRGASSTSLSITPQVKVIYYSLFSHKMAERMGFEPMVRSRESLVFKTSSLNHSDTSPQWPPPRCDSYITISPAECQA